MAYNEILNPMPVIDPDASVSGTITAADTVVGAHAGDGVLRSGTPVANSYVILACPGGDSAWCVEVTGTFGGTTLYWEASVGSTNGINGNWINVNGRQTGVLNTVLNYQSTVAGMFRGNTSGIAYLRVRAVGGAAINVAVIIKISSGTGSVFQNASTPAGSNTIGNIKPALVQTATTNLTAVNQAQTITLQGEAGVSFSVSGTWVGTITFEASNDNFITFSTINAQRAGDNILSQTVVNTAGNDLYRIGVSGFLYIRARMTAFTSGTATVVSGTSLAVSTFVLTSPVTQNTITKGTQGTTGVTTQDLKDAGRTRVSIVFNAVATATADTLLSLVKISNGVAATGATTIAVASTKTLRITGIMFSIKAGAAAIAFATMSLRINPTGAAIISSPIELRFDVGNTAATIGAADSRAYFVPDGFELLGTQQLAVSLAAQATTNIISITLTGFEY